MEIKLSPQVRDDSLAAAVYGDTLHIVINSDPAEVFDFAQLPEGGVLPSSAVACGYIVGSVKRVDGQIELTLLLPIAWDAPRSCTFPEPITTTGDGPVTLPTDKVTP